MSSSSSSFSSSPSSSSPSSSTQSAGRVRRAAARLGVAYVVVASAILLGGWLLRIEDGPLAIANILVQHIALVAVALIPLAALARSRALGVALAVLAVLFGARFGGEWFSMPASSQTGSGSLAVATWNLEAGVAAAPSVVAMLREHPVAIVALEELIPEVAAAIEADPILAARYPYRALFPTEGVTGIGLLSAFPISDIRNESPPIRLEVRALVDGREVAVIAAHPFPARIRFASGWPVGFFPLTRNQDVQLLHDRAKEIEADGTPVILLGDFNTSPAEPAFDRLTAGLRDAHGEVGLGPGWTWRPQRFAFLGRGLLRIDLVLTTSAIAPVRTSIDCRTPSDHCLFEVGLELGSPPPSP